jgi:uncharacterized membrane protein YciS (DUF1049 family)
MKGALVFLLVFALLVVLTIVNVAIPPGQVIYNAVLPGTEAAASYLIAGISSVTVIISVFNGVIYGVIAWVVFTVIMMATRKEKKEQVNVNVTVNNGANPPPPPPPPS